MTPKEKAEKLVNRFGTYAVMWSGGIEVEKQNVKQCALIAVDEIIKPLKDIGEIVKINPAIQFYEEVKQEIEKL